MSSKQRGPCTVLSSSDVVCVIKSGNFDWVADKGEATMKIMAGLGWVRLTQPELIMARKD